MIPMGISADYRGLIWFNGIIMGFQSDTTTNFIGQLGLSADIHGHMIDIIFRCH